MSRPSQYFNAETVLTSATPASVLCLGTTLLPAQATIAQLSTDISVTQRLMAALARIAIITRLTGSSLYCLTFPARHGSLKRHFAQP
ncbi:hypothetical protein BO83DRAFT_382757 [Aspergillus eucalypticola CBS 122712]|uniref:Uncharacterized protein n=1 Tax=Aspergillus eucalypticola (strain CBS 122712 / IBT 29274) TaxID=1448314 RepID=A0A317UQQ5_ASPEC|nr:uncharacterized protein BO83DRAFT_382757 [Aspergillus eucalypticola CBS 122712]PWY63408.1 hypothetical protein BO83DRAFT_382757 [Aspergillus eucalypticola CBS 122712]